MPSPALPVVMTFSASDPSGGAGLQADLLTIASMGCHAATVLTGTTVQDTAGVEEFLPLDADHVDDQARTILEDMPIAAFKIGVLGDVETVAAVAEIVSDYPDLPVVIDPVLSSGRGDAFADDDSLRAIRELLLPLATLVTPNSYEARRLATVEDDEDDDGADDEAPGGKRVAAVGMTISLDDAATRLVGCGAEFVLVTGTHENTNDVVNTLYGERDGTVVRLREDAWQRLPGSYHGSGCTLASAIAALLALGLPLEDAIREGQLYTWNALAAGFRAGMGQFIPDRFYWARAASGFAGRPGMRAS